MTTHPYWLDEFPALHGITDAAWLEAAKAARMVTLPAGKAIFRNADPCDNFFIVARGSVRVQKSSGNSHVIILYHLAPGQICELTTTCLLSGVCYTAEAVAETEVLAVMISRPHFLDALSRSPRFRDFVFSSLGKGMSDLLDLVEQVAFGQMDKRLARCLLGKSHQDNRITGTHKDLAEELGSAREVISRLLEKFCRSGWVRLHRGWIEITDRAALEELVRDGDPM